MSSITIHRFARNYFNRIYKLWSAKQHIDFLAINKSNVSSHADSKYSGHEIGNLVSISFKYFKSNTICKVKELTTTINVAALL